jgi:hypothetical protein
MSSPSVLAPQFQSDAPVSNLDRCNRCGQPRSAHGADWSCPTARPGHAPKVLLVLGSLMALTGGIIAYNTTGYYATVGNEERSSLGLLCLLVGITVAVAAVIQIRRRAGSGGDHRRR